jgi:hypothetical protein
VDRSVPEGARVRVPAVLTAGEVAPAAGAIGESWALLSEPEPGRAAVALSRRTTNATRWSGVLSTVSPGHGCDGAQVKRGADARDDDRQSRLTAALRVVVGKLEGSGAR